MAEGPRTERAGLIERLELAIQQLTVHGSHAYPCAVCHRASVALGVNDHVYLLRASADALAAHEEQQQDWKPTATNVNALPQPIRDYVHRLETNCDPAGDQAALVLERDRTAQLSTALVQAEAREQRLREALTAIVKLNTRREDANIAQATTLAAVAFVDAVKIAKAALSAPAPDAQATLTIAETRALLHDQSAEQQRQRDAALKRDWPDAQAERRKEGADADCHSVDRCRYGLRFVLLARSCNRAAGTS